MTDDCILDDLQWFILAGFFDHPELTAKCSEFWFANKPLRRELFLAFSTFKVGPVGYFDLLERCENFTPYAVACLADAPRPYQAKLTRMISMLKRHLDTKQQVSIVGTVNAS